MTKNTYQLTIGHLYPELMSTYGDRGNITVLQKRASWRGIQTKLLPINESTTEQEIDSIDLLFGGGAQDREQEIVMKDLYKKKKSITKLIENNIPALFVCGAPQLMGNYYEPSMGEKIEGLGIFDMYSKHPGPNAKRLIGNLVAKILWENFDEPVIARNRQLTMTKQSQTGLPRDFVARNDDIIIGFENHGGRTYLGEKTKPLAKVIKGNGNNGEDGTEGVIYKNALGCYLHGPLLPKNPQIADWLIKTALFVKYKKEVQLATLDDSLENMAKSTIAKRLGVAI